MNTPLTRQLDIIVELEETKDLARGLLLALIDEIRHNGPENAASATHEIIAKAQKKLEVCGCHYAMPYGWVTAVDCELHE